jgi:SAM-dependent methyltransferase
MGEKYRLNQNLSRAEMQMMAAKKTTPPLSHLRGSREFFKTAKPAKTAAHHVTFAGSNVRRIERSQFGKEFRMHQASAKPHHLHAAEHPTRTNCPICGPSRTSLIGICNQLPIVSCNSCSLTYVGECPDHSETAAFFRDEYIPDNNSAKACFVDSRQKTLERNAKRIRKLLPGGGRLLDVGTAAGFFLRQFLGKPEWKCEGVEPSRVAAEYARQTFGVDVRDGFLADQKYPASSFDVLCSLDAFCCHRTPREDMQEFHRVLAPGGILAIEIPGHRFRMLTGSGFLYRTLTGKSLRLNAGVTFFYYTRETLAKLAAQAGFELVTSFAESLPTSERPIAQFFRSAWDIASAALYRLTHGHLNFCSKELVIFRKPHLRISDHPGSTIAAPATQALRAG